MMKRFRKTSIRKVGNNKVFEKAKSGVSEYRAFSRPADDPPSAKALSLRLRKIRKFAWIPPKAGYSISCKIAFPKIEEIIVDKTL